MKIKRFINLAFIMITVLASCSKNETPVTTESSDENEFKKLASIELSSIEGTNDSIPGTRTPGSVSGGKPTTIYYGNSVNLLKVAVTDNLSEGSNITNYNFASPLIVTHTFNESEDGNVKSYDLYYKLNITSDNKDKGGTLSGTINLTTGKDGESIDIDLTTFKLEDINSIGQDSILYGLNNFYYGEVNNKLKGIGSILFYLTYNPLDNSTKNGLRLPEIENQDLEFLKDVNHSTLYNEYTDKLFVSDEILIAATEDNIYIFKTLKKYANPGYKLLRVYDRDEKDSYVKRLKIDMARLTTIVNASFLINDTYKDTDTESYYVNGDKETSLNNFKNKFGIEIIDMDCLHATVDGVATLYNINDRSSDNTDIPGRMVLWSSSLEKIIGIDGKQYDKLPSFTDVSIKENVNDLYQGLGILGNSYSVIFKGEVYSGSELRFYTKVKVKDKEEEKTVNILVSTKMHEFTLKQNTVHQLILLIDAQDFADGIKAIINENSMSRANSNDFVELRVPSENLIIN